MLPAPGFWNDPTRKDVPTGSTGSAGLDMLNFGMPAGAEFGEIKGMAPRGGVRRQDAGRIGRLRALRLKRAGFGGGLGEAG